MRISKPIGLLSVPVWSLLLAAMGLASQNPPPAQPPRDVRASQPATGAVLRGRVTRLDTGGPLRRADVRVAGSDLGEGRWASTDAAGHWEIRDLPAGRYTVSVSKAGFITLSFGQKRPFEQGKPVTAEPGATIEKLDVSLPRGSAITGRVYDEFGDPISGARVSAMRYRFAAGRRQLSAAGSTAWDVTDDLGQYRLHGLAAGDYYVAASSATRFAVEGIEPRLGFAPTFYPGTAMLSEAQRVRTEQASEVDGITFTLAVTAVRKVSGTAVNSHGEPLANGLVMLVSGITSGGNPVAGSAVVKSDGTFLISAVAPGEYRLQTQAMELQALVSAGRARGAVPETETVSMPITVADADIEGVNLVTMPAATVKGRVALEGGETASPAGFTVSLSPVDPAVLPIGGPARVREDWTFETAGLSGRVVVRLGSSPPGWMLKSVTRNSEDVTDTGIEFTPGEAVTDLTVVATREMASVAGTVVGANGQPVQDFVAVAFAADAARWRYPTRHVRASRPDRNGKFVVVGLPPGDYLMAALEYLEPGQELDPELLERLRRVSTPVTLNDVEAAAVVLKLVRPE